MGEKINYMRDYHNYLVSQGYTTCGSGKYYKDGNFFVPRFYSMYAALEQLGADTLCKESEQMFYVALEGGAMVC